MRRFPVGDPRVQRLDVLAGATVFRMAEAEHQAEKGEVVVGAEVVTNLGDLLDRARVAAGRKTAGRASRWSAGLTGPVAADPWPPLAPGALTEEQVRPWLLAAVYQRLLRRPGAIPGRAAPGGGALPALRRSRL